MFEQASRIKLRYPSVRGLLTTEDLWDLPLTNSNGMSLDNVAKALNKELKENEEESFVIKSTPENKVITLALDIVKHIISIKLEEASVAKTARINKEKKDRILNIISKKKDEELENASLEDLETMLNDL